MRQSTILVSVTGVLIIALFYLTYFSEKTNILRPIQRDLSCRIHSCYQRGTCLIGKCFCWPGYDGSDCEIATNLTIAHTCTHNNDDKCFIHPLYGIGEVSMERWKKAAIDEGNLWAGSGARDDRWGDHLAGFDNYKMLPNDLGNMVELGCGPFTQTLAILLYTKKPVNITKLTLWDPSAKQYIERVPHCTYKNGSLINFSHIPTNIVSLPSEEMRFHIYEFDTILIINVLEHVQNAYQILQNMYNSLKPNGVLIFGERWWDQLYKTENYQSDSMHPVRIKYYVWKWFTSHFETLYDVRNHLSYSKYGGNGSYFIGRKR